MNPSRRHSWVPVLLLVFAACGTPEETVGPDALRLDVLETERRFARSMAERDFDAFTGYLAEEAVFFSGETPLRGRAQVAAAWRGYFDGPDAPFSWEPETVVVLESGTLALSTGPVFDEEGIVVATFTSIWRREAVGTWRIVFDRGCSACPG